MKSLRELLLEKYEVDPNFDSADFEHRLAMQDKIMKWLSPEVMPPFDTRYKYKLDDQWYLILSNIGHSKDSGALNICVGNDKLSYRYYGYLRYNVGDDYEKVLEKVLWQAKRYNNTYSPYVYTWTPESREWKRELKPYYYDDGDFSDVKIFDITDAIKF